MFWSHSCDCDSFDVLANSGEASAQKRWDKLESNQRKEQSHNQPSPAQHGKHLPQRPVRSHIRTDTTALRKVSAHFADSLQEPAFPFMMKGSLWFADVCELSVVTGSLHKSAKG